MKFQVHETVQEQPNLDIRASDGWKLKQRGSEVGTQREASKTKNDREYQVQADCTQRVGTIGFNRLLEAVL